MNCPKCHLESLEIIPSHRIEIEYCHDIACDHIVTRHRRHPGLGRNKAVARTTPEAYLLAVGRSMSDAGGGKHFRHGIAEADVAGAPTFAALWPTIKEIISGRIVIIYNADFDQRMMRQSAAAHGIETRGSIRTGSAVCAMLLYADYVGDWDEYHGNNRWFRLEVACRQMKVDCSGIQAHSAAGNCELTRRLIHALAAKQAYKVLA